MILPPVGKPSLTLRTLLRVFSPLGPLVTTRFTLHLYSTTVVIVMVTMVYKVYPSPRPTYAT